MATARCLAGGAESLRQPSRQYEPRLGRNAGSTHRLSRENKIVIRHTSAHEFPRTTNPMKHLPTLARILLGLVFLVFGLDGFFHYIPQPKEVPPEGAMAFGMAMMKTGYLFQLVKGTEAACGALLLVNLFAP